MDYHERQRARRAQQERERDQQAEAARIARRLGNVSQKLGASPRMRQLTAATTPPRVIEGTPERVTVSVRQFHRIPAGDKHDLRSSCWCGPAQQPGLNQSEVYWQHRPVAAYEQAPSPYLSGDEVVRICPCRA